MKSIMIAFAALALVLTASGCKEKKAHHNSTGTRAEKDVDNAVDETEDEVQKMGEDIESETQRGLEQAEKDTGEVRDDVEDVVADVDKTAESATGKRVTAEIASIDKKTRKITFHIKHSAEEIQLQAGKELTVDFAELPTLTGLSEEEAVDALREGEDLEVKVVGIGDAMKITRVELPKIERPVPEK